MYFKCFGIGKQAILNRGGNDLNRSLSPLKY